MVASLHRKFQQDAELHGRNTDTANIFGTLDQPSGGDREHHRASLPVDFESSVHHDPVSRPTDHHINLRQPSYRDTRPHEVVQPATFTYNPDITSTLGHLSYAESLSVPLFRPPSITEMDIRRQSIHPILQPSRDVRQEIPKQNSYLTVKETLALSNSSQSSLSLESGNSDTSIYDELRQDPLDNESESRLERQDLQQDGVDVAKSKLLEEEDGAVADSFSNLDKMFENWDATDNEWLYSLQTECARPGVVCECGDSCCCPGCFTHTNNAGDRGVYDTLLNKMGSILETENQGNEHMEGNKPCH